MNYAATQAKDTDMQITTSTPRNATAASVRIAVAALAILLITVLASAAPASATARVPFKGSDRGTFTTTDQGFPLILTNDVATGHATHVGAYRIEAHETINVVSHAVTDGAYTLTAADGDTIVGTYEGSTADTTDPDVITYHVAGPVIGGTGRFDGASGFLTFAGIANLRTGYLADKIRGWISSPGCLS